MSGEAGGDYKRLNWGAEIGAAWFCLRYGCLCLLPLVDWSQRR